MCILIHHLVILHNYVYIDSSSCVLHNYVYIDSSSCHLSLLPPPTHLGCTEGGRNQENPKTTKLRHMKYKDFYYSDDI